MRKCGRFLLLSLFAHCLLLFAHFLCLCPLSVLLLPEGVSCLKLSRIVFLQTLHRRLQGPRDSHMQITTQRTFRYIQRTLSGDTWRHPLYNGLSPPQPSTSPPPHRGLSTQVCSCESLSSSSSSSIILSFRELSLFFSPFLSFSLSPSLSLLLSLSFSLSRSLSVSVSL